MRSTLYIGSRELRQVLEWDVEGLGRTHGTRQHNFFDAAVRAGSDLASGERNVGKNESLENGTAADKTEHHESYISVIE